MPAEFELTFAPIAGRSGEGPVMPAFDGRAAASETMTSADTPSNISAGANMFARGVNTGDADIYVDFNLTPDATVAPRWFLGIGQTLITGVPEGARASFTTK